MATRVPLGAAQSHERPHRPPPALRDLTLSLCCRAERHACGTGREIWTSSSTSTKQVPPPHTFAGGSRKFSGSRVRVWGSEGRPGGFALDLRTRLGLFFASCRQPRREQSPGVWAGATARLSAARPGIEPVTSEERSRAPVPRLRVAQWRASRRACLFSAPRRRKSQKKSSNSGFPEHCRFCCVSGP